MHVTPGASGGVSVSVSVGVCVVFLSVCVYLYDVWSANGLLESQRSAQVKFKIQSHSVRKFMP